MRLIVEFEAEHRGMIIRRGRCKETGEYGCWVDGMVGCQGSYLQAERAIDDLLDGVTVLVPPLRLVS